MISQQLPCGHPVVLPLALFLHTSCCFITVAAPNCSSWSLDFYSFQIPSPHHTHSQHLQPRIWCLVLYSHHWPACLLPATMTFPGQTLESPNLNSVLCLTWASSVPPGATVPLPCKWLSNGEQHSVAITPTPISLQATTYIQSLISKISFLSFIASSFSPRLTW